MCCTRCWRTGTRKRFAALRFFLEWIFLGEVYGLICNFAVSGVGADDEAGFASYALRRSGPGAGGGAKAVVVGGEVE